jgi:hypothetical protein
MAKHGEALRAEPDLLVAFEHAAAAQIDSEPIEAENGDALCRSGRTLQGGVSPSETPISAFFQVLREGRSGQQH